jgi:hypothetical protein
MEHEEFCVAKSFSLKRNLIAGIRLRAKALKMSMSAYVAALFHNDLAYGIDRPFAISPRTCPFTLTKAKAQERRAVSWSSSICRTNDLPPCFIHWPHEREARESLARVVNPGPDEVEVNAERFYVAHQKT